MDESNLTNPVENNSNPDLPASSASNDAALSAEEKSISSNPPEVISENITDAKKPNKSILYIVGLIIFLVIAGSAAGVYFLYPREEVTQPEEEQMADSSSTDQNDNTPNVDPNEPESFGIDQSQPPTVVETPVTPPAAQEPVDTTPEKPTAPANNRPPEVTVLSYYLEDWEHDSDKGVTIITRAEDPDGKISKVEIYVDGDKEATITPYNIGGVERTWLDDPEDIFEVEQAALEWLEDETDDGEDMGYVYRQSKEWTNSAESCGIPRGYTHIILGDHNIYDVRTARDLEKHVICKKSDSIGIDDLFYFMWDPSGGSHDTYAIAYDQYGASTRSDKVEFNVD